MFVPKSVLAYIGPGAGFAVVSSLATLVVSFLIAFLLLFLLPLRLLFSFLQSGKSNKNAKVKRVVIIGFDGMDPELCDQFLDDGELPNFAHLQKTGTYKRLETTCPPLSPVAWSSFATGVNPAKHGIFDFVHRNPKNYNPELSSSKISTSQKRIKIAKLDVFRRKQQFHSLRKGISFWKILGDHKIFSQIVRVPITFPPEKFNGHLLSAMCTPDLRGTQGTFSFYSTKEIEPEQNAQGTYYKFELCQDGFVSKLYGPNGQNNVRSELVFRLYQKNEKTYFQVNREKIELKLGSLSSWITVVFKSKLNLKIYGICQLVLTKPFPEPELYVSPIQIHPEHPAMPVSTPHYYSIYLSKLYGNFATLGLAEDTWALNEGVLTEEQFLDQVDCYQQERERQLFHAIKHNRNGVVACVFDSTDRVQHTFFRYIDPSHPCFKDGTDRTKYAIRDVYKKVDKIVGELLKKISKDTLLIILSDHGFKSFRRGININSWLHQNGYLVLKEGKQIPAELNDIDWDKTQAYALGLAGIYINRKGREKQGCVKSEDVYRLKLELLEELTDLRDPKTNEQAIKTLYDFEQTNVGPYSLEAPDLIVGYNPGFRISWDGALGQVTDSVIQDNTKAWSGDHGIDFHQVPGVLFSNFNIKNDNPNIMDFAPTILELYGIEKSANMDGKTWHIAGLNDELHND